MSAITTADLLRAAFPVRTAKSAGCALRRSHRTIEDWIQRRCSPSADDLLRWAQENEALRAEMLRALTKDGYAGLADGVDGAALQAKSGTGAPARGEVAAANTGDAQPVAWDGVERRGRV